MVGRALCMLFVRLVGLEGGSRSDDCTSRSGSRRRSFQASLALFSEKLGQHHPPPPRCGLKGSHIAVQKSGALMWLKQAVSLDDASISALRDSVGTKEPQLLKSAATLEPKILVLFGAIKFTRLY